MLHWVRRFIAVRKRFPVFGEGSFEALDAANPSVFAFLRSMDGQTVLCVNNLSRFAQPVELDLRRYDGTTPIEMLGRVHFPAHRRAAVPVDDGPARLLLVHAGAPDRMSSQDGGVTAMLRDHRLDNCEGALGAYIARQRWAGAQGRTIEHHRDRRRGGDQRELASAAAHADRGHLHRRPHHAVRAPTRHPHGR